MRKGNNSKQNNKKKGENGKERWFRCVSDVFKFYCT